jgi:hypothetical protein
VTTITLDRLKKKGYETFHEYFTKVSTLLNEPLYTRPVPVCTVARETTRCDDLTTGRVLD